MSEPLLGEIVYLGLGSNLDDPRGQICRALDALAGLSGARILDRSRLYRTAPVGPAGQPDYVNAAVALDVTLSPLDLLDAVQAIEHSQGRRRDGERWGPRTLDLDVLLFGQRRIDSGRLSVPHPRMHERAFVLIPLADIAPEGLEIPGRGTLGERLRICPAADVTPLGKPCMAA